MFKGVVSFMAVLTCNFMSQTLGRVCPIFVVLPVPAPDSLFNPDIKPYEKKPPFKTLYLLHGITGNYTGWVYDSRIAQYAENKGIAVVMPSGENSFYTDNDRCNRYGEYIGQELVTATRQMFNLSHKREDTYIAGLSMGGYGALRNGMKYSDTFSRIGAFSSAIIQEGMEEAEDDAFIFFKNRAYYERVFGDLTQFKGSDMDVYALAEKKPDVKFYITCGTEDFLIEPNRKFAKHLKTLDADLYYEESPGSHDSDFWEKSIKQFVAWL
jgi:S-formylglutathione hydrolase FrmB